MKLRALEISDLPLLYQWENDATAWADGDTHNPLSQHLLREYIESSTGDLYKDGQLRLVIEDEGAIAGCLDLFDLDPRSRRAAMGLYIAPAHRGKGLAKAAVEWALSYAREFLHLHQLYAIIRCENKACCRIYEELDFTRDAVLRDWVIRPDGSYDDAILFQKILDKRK
jgi:diamine N-acetyltransferase